MVGCNTWEFRAPVELLSPVRKATASTIAWVPAWISSALTAIKKDIVGLQIISSNLDWTKEAAGRVDIASQEKSGYNKE